MNSKSTGIQAKLKRLHQEYARRLPDKIREIEQAWQILLTDGNSETRQHLARLCHTLAGSAASYGFQQVTDLSRQIEQLIAAAIAEQKILDEPEQTRINQYLAQLRVLATQSPDNRLEAPAESGAAPDPRLIYLFTETGQDINDVAGQIRNYGYTIEIFEDRHLLQQKLRQQIPVAVILSCSLQQHPEETLQRFASIAQQVPTLLITDKDDVYYRLLTVRNHISAYFSRPINILDLVDLLDRYSQEEQAEPCRVLIVEDSLATAEFYLQHLQDAGMEVRYITEPLQVLEVINQFDPELILMDLYLADCNGKELSELIRQKESNLSTPIVFLSAESDLDKQLSVIPHGDDFLTKPITPEHLVAAVRSITRRFRDLRAMMLKDSLTGLYNHTTLIDLLYRELQRASRHEETLSYVMLDIDHFKSVNDNYGHDTGDQVIKSLSRLLRQRLRSSDYIGRYGGEEFGVILPDTTAEAAQRVIESIRLDFAGLRQPTSNGEIFCTFSAGIADNRLSDDSGTLTRAADAALYLAKQAGRNRSIMAEPETLRHFHSTGPRD